MGEDADKVYERWQVDTAEYRNRLLTAAEASPGYAGAELRPDENELVIFATEGPTEAMADLLRESPTNLRVTLLESPHTRAGLTAEVRRLMTAQRSRLHSASPRHDGTGIQVTTTDTELLRTQDPQRALSARYPIFVEYEERPIPVAR
jgi:hypothetical protein